MATPIAESADLVAEQNCGGLRTSARTIPHPRAPALYGRRVANSKASRTRVSTAIRLPTELHAELQRHAEERDVSVNFLVTRAVDHYLRQLGPADPLATELTSTA